MKKLVLVGLFAVISVSAFCQIKERIEQIIKLEAYLDWLKKGYGIVNKGLNLINDIKHGDFNLHEDYFSSLKQVKGPIKDDAKIARMIAWQAQMLNSYKAYYKEFRTSGVYTSQELDYLHRVFTALLDDAAKDITALTVIVTNGALEASDDERIARINELYERMDKKYEFLCAFGNATQLQTAQRKKELEIIGHLKKLY